MAKEKTKKDPKVVFLGNEVGEEEKTQEEVRPFRFRKQRGSFIWGLFFILLGVLFLLSNFGALPPATWEQISKLWPVLIILIGLDTLMGHSDAGDIVSSIIGFFIFGTILGVVLYIAAPGILGGFPQGIVDYFGNISDFLQLR